MSPYYDYDYDSSYQSIYDLYNNLDAPSASTVASAGVGVVAGFMLFFLCSVVLVWVVLTVIAKWKIFVKAGKDGWKSLIPIYSEYTLLEILSMEPLLCLLSVLPVSHFMLSIVMKVKLAKSFKKGTGFAIGLILLEPIFEMILAFGDAKYVELPSSK